MLGTLQEATFAYLFRLITSFPLAIGPVPEAPLVITSITQNQGCHTVPLAPRRSLFITPRTTSKPRQKSEELEWDDSLPPSSTPPHFFAFAPAMESSVF